MTEQSGFSYVEAQFDSAGALAAPGQQPTVLDAIRTAALSDLLVLSHGWNNDMEEARNLYTAILAHLAAMLPRAPLGDGRRLGVLGVLWPSKRFTECDLIPGGGAAGLGAGLGGPDVSTADLEAGIDRLSAVATPGGPDLAAAKALLDRLERDPAARQSFVNLVRDSLDAPVGASAATPEVSATLLAGDAEQIFMDLRTPLLAPVAGPGPGGAAGGIGAVGSIPAGGPFGGAAGLGSMFASARAAAERLLNFATYYQMKERAGVVGHDGLAKLLAAVREREPSLRIHLAGHSFGARLVTSAADACDAAVRPASLMLLQAAFSHNSFAPKFVDDGEEHVGFFRQVIDSHKIAGPILATHTVNDKAVGLAYAIASRLARQAASAIGTTDDLYGGLGRNGAVRTPECVIGGSLLAPAPGSPAYDFQQGRIHNLQADQFIHDHGDIANDAVAYAMLHAIR